MNRITFAFIVLFLTLGLSYGQNKDGLLTKNPNLNDTSIKIQPNPVKNFTIVRLTKSNESLRLISIYDVTGKLIKKIQGSNNKLNLSNLKSGIYLLRIELDSGELSTKKILKL